MFLEHHIEQLNTTSDQLKHLNDSNDHMLHMFGELSRTLRVHDEEKLFQTFGEVRSSKIVKIQNNLSEGFQVQVEFINKFQRRVDESGPAWTKIREAIKDMYQKTKQYKLWLQEHNHCTSNDNNEFPMHFAQEFDKFHTFWDCQEANIVRDSLPAKALDTVFTMIARYGKYLKEVQSEHKLPSDLILSKTMFYLSKTSTRRWLHLIVLPIL